MVLLPNFPNILNLLQKYLYFTNHFFNFLMSASYLKFTVQKKDVNWIIEGFSI